ncbi:MAG: hypothetical protein F4206_05410 [Gammaproteobacteria bacterium]|nr:hypothetical protein [Gammaproteobacteria bacterium]MYG66154.1 hypothetical protein [Gammaproteobacteria bacterium]
MSIQSKYSPLETHLKSAGFKEILMTFEEIEAVIGTSLPPSARKHRPWWSNNPSNSVMTHSWLAAGYKTSRVDISNECLVFVKDDPRGLHDSSPQNPEMDSGKHPVFGCMAGTVTVAEDLDLTSPAMPEWANMAHQDLCHE